MLTVLANESARKFITTRRSKPIGSFQSKQFYCMLKFYMLYYNVLNRNIVSDEIFAERVSCLIHFGFDSAGYDR